jgi:hypothetical protein
VKDTVYPESNHQISMNLTWARGETLKEGVATRKKGEDTIKLFNAWKRASSTKKKMLMRQERDNAAGCPNLVYWWLPIEI